MPFLANCIGTRSSDEAGLGIVLPAALSRSSSLRVVRIRELVELRETIFHELIFRWAIISSYGCYACTFDMLRNMSDEACASAITP